MVTETKTATAAQEPDKKPEPATAEQQAADAAAAEAAAKVLAGAEKPPEKPDPLQALRDDITAMRRELGGFQGKMAQRVGQSQKELREEIRGLRAQINTRDEAALVAGMEPDERAEYWRKKAQAPPPAADKADTDKADSWLSQGDQTRLAEQVSLLLDGAGLQMELTDPKLWTGAYTGMEPDELLQVARQNIRGLRAPAKPEAKPEAKAAVKPPPSTRNMPKTPRHDYSSRSELADALTAGDIDSDQYRAELKRIQPP